jgi:DNA invertase Pin-like site-specific DNA recombinase
MGYARLSTEDQPVTLQLQTLRQHGCESEWLVVDVASKARAHQPGLEACLASLIDTTTASGELVFHPFSALAQFEWRRVQERTRAGLQAARIRERQAGRKPLDPQAPRVHMARVMHCDKHLRITNICHTLHISRATFSRHLTWHEAQDRQSYRAARTTS